MQLINLLFLMWIVLMPFSTALVGEYEHHQLPVIIYALHNMLTSLTLTWLWRHATSDSSLLEANVDPLPSRTGGCRRKNGGHRREELRVGHGRGGLRRCCARSGYAPSRSGSHTRDTMRGVQWS